MKTYLIRYEQNTKGIAMVQAGMLKLGRESRTAILYDGAEIKAIFPLEHISGIREVGPEELRQVAPSVI